MPSHRQLNPLTNRQKSICEWGGLLGILLSLTCLIQHIAVVIPRTVTHLMIPEYIFAVVAFSFLGLQKMAAPVLLIISAVYAAVVEYLWMTHESFSLVVLLLFIYHIVAIVIIYTEQLPQALKQKVLAEKQERDSWAGKI